VRACHDDLCSESSPESDAAITQIISIPAKPIVTVDGTTNRLDWLAAINATYYEVDIKFNYNEWSEA
jgi:hypothetical protein